MLNKKTDNFNDFSRYYSEENQELLEKKSRRTPFILLSLLLFIMSFSYLIYIYLLKQQNSTNRNDSFKSKIITENTPILPIVITEVHTEKPILEKKISTIIKEKNPIKNPPNRLFKVILTLTKSILRFLYMNLTIFDINISKLWQNNMKIGLSNCWMTFGKKN